MVHIGVMERGGVEHLQDKIENYFKLASIGKFLHIGVIGGGGWELIICRKKLRFIFKSASIGKFLHIGVMGGGVKNL